jgi:hypothetical protein
MDQDHPGKRMVRLFPHLRPRAAGVRRELEAGRFRGGEVSAGSEPCGYGIANSERVAACQVRNRTARLQRRLELHAGHDPYPNSAEAVPGIYLRQPFCLDREIVLLCLVNQSDHWANPNRWTSTIRRCLALVSQDSISRCRPSRKRGRW